MNIFMVDDCPVKAAQALVDKHVIKMILESAQLLSTAHRILDGKETIVEGWVDEFGVKHKKSKHWVLNDGRDDILYRATHIKHPSAIWVRNSVENYNWLVDHLFALGDEYRYRYEKSKAHASIIKMGYELQSPPYNLKEWDWTPMPCCMPDCYKTSDNPVINYRNYYRDAKSELHSWKKRNKPDWI